MLPYLDIHGVLLLGSPNPGIRLESFWKFKSKPGSDSIYHSDEICLQLANYRLERICKLKQTFCACVTKFLTIDKVIVKFLLEHKL